MHYWSILGKGTEQSFVFNLDSCRDSMPLEVLCRCSLKRHQGRRLWPIDTEVSNCSTNSISELIDLNHEYRKILFAARPKHIKSWQIMAIKRHWNVYLYQTWDDYVTPGSLHNSILGLASWDCPSCWYSGSKYLNSLAMWQGACQEERIWRLIYIIMQIMIYSANCAHSSAATSYSERYIIQSMWEEACACWSLWRTDFVCNAYEGMIFWSLLATGHYICKNQRHTWELTKLRASSSWKWLIWLHPLDECSNWRQWRSVIIRQESWV